MTTPQPNPTDDLEAVDPRYEVDVQYEVWCGPNMEAASDDLNEARRYEAQYQPCSLLKATTYRQPVGLPDATPAHPDDALMERVREKIDEAFMAGAQSVHDYWTENPGEAPAGDPEFGEAAGDYAYAAVQALLSDLKAEAGR